MHNTISIKENREFLRLYKHGKFVSSDCLILYYRKNNLGLKRIGITVSKKVGKAVVRNRIRRRIKENFREIENQIPEGYDIVIVSRVKAAEYDYKKIGSALRYMLKKAEML